MLNSLKAMNQARKFKSQMEQRMAKIFYSAKKGDNEIVVDGNRKAVKVVIDGVERGDILSLMNTAMKEVQKKIEKEMKSDDNAAEMMSMLKSVLK